MREPQARSGRRHWQLGASPLLLCALVLLLGPPAEGQTPAASAEIEQLFKRGLELSAQGLIEPAIVTFQEILAKDKKNVEARLELGKLALRAYNWAYAIQMFGELVELRPNDTELLRVVLEVYDSYNMEIEALQAAIKLAALESTNPEALLRLAKLYRSQGLIPEEIQTYERLAALKPDDPGPLWTLADLYGQRGRDAEALAAYERIRRLTSEDPRILKRLARIYGERGRYDQQIALYEALNRRDPEAAPLFRLALAQAREEAGRAAEDAGNYWRARSYYLEALRDDPALEAASRGAARTASLLRPMLGYQYSWEDYRLDVDTTRRIHLVSGLIPLPLSGSSLLVENATILVRGGGERALANGTGLSWEQLVGSWLKLRAGASGMAVAEGEVIPDPAAPQIRQEFSGARLGYHAGAVWQPLPLLALATAVKREQITDSPKAFSQSIRRTSWDNGVTLTVDVLDRPLSLSGSAMLSHYSDGNNATALGAAVEYALLYGRPEPAEDPGPVPVEERTRPRYKVALEYAFDRIVYDQAVSFYASSLEEETHSGFVKAEVQFLTRTWLSGSAQFGEDQKGQRIRYYAGELSTNWFAPLRAWVRYEEGTTTALQGSPSHVRKFLYGITYRF